MRRLLFLLVTIVVVLGAGCHDNPLPQSNLQQDNPRTEGREFGELTLSDGLYVIYPKGWSISETSTDLELIFNNRMPGSDSMITLALFRSSPPGPLGCTLSRGDDWVTEEMPSPGMILVYNYKVRDNSPSNAVWGMKNDQWSYLYSLEIIGEPTEEDIKQALVLFRGVINEFVRVNGLS